MYEAFREWWNKNKAKYGIELTEVQHEWIREALTRGAIIVSYTGTGKTTALSVLADFLSSIGKPVLYIASSATARQLRRKVKAKVLSSAQLAARIPKKNKKISKKTEELVEFLQKRPLVIIDDAEFMLRPLSTTALFVLAYATHMLDDYLDDVQLLAEALPQKAKELRRLERQLVPKKLTDPKQAAEFKVKSTMVLNLALGNRLVAVASASPFPPTRLGLVLSASGAPRRNAVNVVGPTMAGGAIEVHGFEVSNWEEAVERLWDEIKDVPTNALVFVDEPSPAEVVDYAMSLGNGKCSNDWKLMISSAPKGLVFRPEDIEDLPVPGDEDACEGRKIVVSSAHPKATAIRGLDTKGKIPVAFFVGFPTVKVKVRVPQSIEELEDKELARKILALLPPKERRGSKEKLFERAVKRGEELGLKRGEEGLLRIPSPFVFMQAAGRTSRVLSFDGEVVKMNRGVAVVYEWRKEVLPSISSILNEPNTL